MIILRMLLKILMLLRINIKEEIDLINEVEADIKDIEDTMILS